MNIGISFSERENLHFEIDKENQSHHVLASQMFKYQFSNNWVIHYLRSNII